MGKIEQEFENCVAKGKIRAFSDGPNLVSKQIKIATDDLFEAEQGLTRQRWKWSTIQAYYSMFHSARALLYAKGFRERSHRCLRIAIAHLYAAEPDDFYRLLDNFELAKQMRENADYADDFSENNAKKLVTTASKFVETAKKMLG